MVGITMSYASIIPIIVILGGSDKEFDETLEAKAFTLLFPYVFVVYCASKIAAYKATKDFIAKEKPVYTRFYNW